MRLRAHWACAAAIAALAISNTAAGSYPAGVWVKVQDVVFEPASGTATSVQIHGAVMLYDGSIGGSYYGYAEPALGYLYYECPKGSEATCASEWADVNGNISEPLDVCVGLGDQKVPTGTLRAPGAPVQDPDAYPIAMGVLPGFTPCKVLSSFLLSQPDGGAGSGGEAGAAGGGGVAGEPATGGATSSGGTSSGGSASNTGGASPETGGSAGAPSGADSDHDGGCTIARAGTTSALGLGLVGIALLGARRLRRRER
jgi:hypothetical protein